MHRRRFLPLVASGAAAFAVPRLALAEDGAMTPEAAPASEPPTPQGRGGMRNNPRFQALSMAGKRQIEYARPLLNKLPPPGRQVMMGFLLRYDTMTAEQRERLARAITYIEYMRGDELQTYLVGADDGTPTRQHMHTRLRALADEPRIPYHSGPKTVVVGWGPAAAEAELGAAADAALFPHTARDLLPSGTFYTQVRDTPGSLAALTTHVLAGEPEHAAAPARLIAAGVPREAVWAIAGAHTNARALAGGAHAPYLLTTDDARAVDEFVARHNVRERMRQARTQTERRALRAELLERAEDAFGSTGLHDRFPDPRAQRFAGQVLFRERGIKDRGNTFVHVGGLRTMQLVHPTWLYVQFGGPDESLRRDRGGAQFGEQGAVGQGAYTDRDYASDLDQWTYYHWLEAQRHPHYAGEATFIALFGPGRDGRTRALVSGPGGTPGRVQREPISLRGVLEQGITPLRPSDATAA